MNPENEARVITLYKIELLRLLKNLILRKNMRGTANDLHRKARETGRMQNQIVERHTYLLYLVQILIVSTNSNRKYNFTGAIFLSNTHDRNFYRNKISWLSFVE